MKNRISVIPIPVEMEARVQESMKGRDSNARVKKGTRGKAVKRSTSVFLILVKMVQHAQKEQEGDSNVPVLSATKALLVKKEAFVILTRV